MTIRVYVKTDLFEGWATVNEYFPKEPFFPLQITLDEPDEDGHSYKRVSKEHIIKREEIKNN
jgi:hypothetical protein